MYLVKVDPGKEFQIQTKNNQVLIDNENVNLDFQRIGSNKYRVFSKNKVHLVEIIDLNKDDKVLKLKVNDKTAEVKLKTSMDLLLEKLGMDKGSAASMKDLKAPMPGLILQVSVSEGQEVKKGDPLLILEAMKMENVIKAQGDATIKSILVKEKQSVEKNQALMQF